jgi:hypothetical protein
MALDFSGLDTQAAVDALVERYQALATELATIGATVNVSDKGRSISNERRGKAIQEEMAAIRLQLSRMAGPGFVTSRWKA